MDNIKRILSTVVMIFPNDEIYLSSIRRNESIHILNEKYKLKLLQQADTFLMSQNQLTFREGEFILNAVPYPIDELTIDERRLIIKTQSTSEVALKLFQSIKEDLLSFDYRKKKPKYEPIITSYDTACVCQLRTKISEKLNNAFLNNFLVKTGELMPKYDSHLSIIPFSLKFKIEYFNISPKLSKNKITLSDKFLTIEYREKTDPEDRYYFISSPTDSSTHFEIIKAFENMLDK